MTNEPHKNKQSQQTFKVIISKTSQNQSIIFLTPFGEVTKPVIGTTSYALDNSADGKARIARFLSESTRLLPLGFHFTFITFSPLCTSIYCGSEITHDPVGVHTKTLGIPVPITSYCE